MSRILLLLTALAAVFIAAGFYLRNEGSGNPTAADDDGAKAKAVLRNSAGDRVGSVKFSDDDDGVHVKVVVDGPLDGGPFHGFHVHETGTCTAPSFTSAGFHLDHAGTGAGGTAHPSEAGDMPVLLENADGSAEARLVTDRFEVADLLEGDGTAVIVHLNPDNYANIPAARYELITGTPAPGGPAGSAADQATLNTGDAGGRVACGVIEGE